MAKVTCPDCDGLFGFCDTCNGEGEVSLSESQVLRLADSNRTRFTTSAPLLTYQPRLRLIARDGRRID